MFMLPEPPPLDYYLTDISPTLCADGVFYHGKPAATHKYVAKQLKPIGRTLHDPLAPIQELDPRSLDRSLAKEKELYVDTPLRDDGVVYQTLSFLPRRRRDYQRTQRPALSIFPRSPQYELWYIREQRLKNFEKHRRPVVECTIREETHETDDEPCRLLKPPIWWKDKSAKRSSLPIGNINDYAFEKSKDFREQDAKLSETLHMDHPKKYIPGVIHRLQNPEDTSMKDALERADAFKVVSKGDRDLPTSPPVEKRARIAETHPSRVSTPCEVREHRDTEATGSKMFDDGDARWQPLAEDLDVPKTNLERQTELRMLTRPFSYDLHTWYSKNKPTKLIVPLRQPGKKAIPERRFSHL